MRTNLSEGRIARVFFCFHEGILIALHGIIKKTQTTPKQELKLALDRKKEITR